MRGKGGTKEGGGSTDSYDMQGQKIGWMHRPPGQRRTPCNGGNGRGKKKVVRAPHLRLRSALKKICKWRASWPRPILPPESMASNSQRRKRTKGGKGTLLSASRGKSDCSHTGRYCLRCFGIMPIGGQGSQP